MKVVIQRVNSASVTVNNEVVSKINNGLLVLVGLHTDDTEEKFDYFINKILNLRIFSDNAGVMNKSILDFGGEILLVSQFTLYADCKKGNRPSYMHAMPPKDAGMLYANFVTKFREKYSKVFDGKFGAYMKVALENDGPVTIILEQ